MAADIEDRFHPLSPFFSWENSLKEICSIDGTLCWCSHCWPLLFTALSSFAGESPLCNRYIMCVCDKNYEEN